MLGLLNLLSSVRDQGRHILIQEIISKKTAESTQVLF